MNKINISNWSLANRVLATLAYFDIFRKPLKIEELSFLILGSKEFANDILVIIGKLKNKIIEQDNYFYLKDSKFDLDLVKKNDDRFESLLKKSLKYQKLFSYLPFVDGVAICNYLPFGIVEENSDIDLFIVTQKDRIMIARTFTTLLFHLLGIRRHGNLVKDRFCLSFYINRDFSNLSDLILEDDIYFAYWILALYPIYGDFAYWNFFRSENKTWLNKYFDGRREKIYQYFDTQTIIKKFLQWLLVGRFGDFLENYLLKNAQKRFKLRKDLDVNSSIIINDKRLKYHNNDKRLYFYQQWELRLKRLGLFN